MCRSSCLRAAVAAEPPCSAPISRDNVQKIIRVIRAVTSKPILGILGVDEEKFVPGAVIGHAYLLDIKTGKRTDRYTRTDLVNVYMTYMDRSHVDVYTVRKTQGRWRIEKKFDWFL